MKIYSKNISDNFKINLKSSNSISCLKSVASVPLSTRYTIVGVVVTGGANIHTVVGLDVATSGVVARDAALSLLLLGPRGVVATDAVNCIDQNLGCLFHVLLRIVVALGSMVTSVNLHQTESVASATMAIAPSKLAIPSLESRAGTRFAGNNRANDTMINAFA